MAVSYFQENSLLFFHAERCLLIHASQVKEYVLVGEADGYICGHPEQTWGVSPCDINGNDSDSEDGDGCDTEMTVPECHAPVVWETSSRGTSGESGSWLIEGKLPVCAADADRNAAHHSDKDVFLRIDLADLSGLQVCCTDERWLSTSNSRTVSFRRVASSMSPCQ